MNQMFAHNVLNPSLESGDPQKTSPDWMVCLANQILLMIKEPENLVRSTEHLQDDVEGLATFSLLSLAALTL